jgi:MFS family permease
MEGQHGEIPERVGRLSSPLRRNRDFVLLQTGQLLSQSGTKVTSIAYPLLALSLSGSATLAGVVGFAGFIAEAVFALPAGLLADRWSRKRLMIASDALRFVMIAVVTGLIVSGELALWIIPLAAFVEGLGSSFFEAAQQGALRAVVPATQLAAAINVVTGRRAAVNIGGPVIGGALFGLARALPFLVDAVSYAFSTLSLLAMRTPFEEQRDAPTPRAKGQLLEGFRFVWSHPFLRTTTLVFAPLGFVGMSYTLAVIIIAKEQGLSGSAVGALVASFGAAVLLGSALSPQIRRKLPARAVLLLELWMWAVPIVFLAWPNVYVLGLSLLPAALSVPSSDSVAGAYRLLLTPDRLVGRVSSVITTVSFLPVPFGQLLTGFLLGVTSPRVTVAFFVAVALICALVATLSPALRSLPSIADRPA